MFKLKKLFKKIYNKIYNFFYLVYIRNFKKYLTLSSKPLISGDSFKNIANHKFDEVNKFNPLQVNKSEIIFVKTDYLNIFINDYLHKLPDEITVITHNSDINIFGDEIKKFEEKRIQWYAQNLNINQTTSKFIHFLPLGFENRNWFKNGKLNTLYSFLLVSIQTPIQIESILYQHYKIIKISLFLEDHLTKNICPNYPSINCHYVHLVME